MEPLSEGRASQSLPSLHQGIPKAGGVHWHAALLYKPQEETDDSAQVKSSKLLFSNFTASKLLGINACQNFTKKSNGRNEIFEKKTHGKEMSHDGIKPLLG